MKKLKDNIINKDQGFILPLCFLVFYILERVSVFYWIRQCAKGYYKGKSIEKPLLLSCVFPEIWVVGNIILAVIIKEIINSPIDQWLIILFGIYAIERTFEMIIYQINVLFFHKLNKEFFEEPKGEHKKEPKEGANEYKIKSVTRSIILLILNMVEYILQFSVMFGVVGALMGIKQVDIGPVESFLIFMNSYDLSSFRDNPIISLAFGETVIGLFMNILCISYFIGMLPQVKAENKY